jgi:hypothetical protein
MLNTDSKLWEILRKQYTPAQIEEKARLFLSFHNGKETMQMEAKTGKLDFSKEASNFYREFLSAKRQLPKLFKIKEKRLKQEVSIISRDLNKLQKEINFSLPNDKAIKTIEIVNAWDFSASYRREKIMDKLAREKSLREHFLEGMPSARDEWRAFSSNFKGKKNKKKEVCSNLRTYSPFVEIWKKEKEIFPSRDTTHHDYVLERSPLSGCPP